VNRLPCCDRTTRRSEVVVFLSLGLGFAGGSTDDRVCGRQTLNHRGARGAAIATFQQTLADDIGAAVTHAAGPASYKASAPPSRRARFGGKPPPAEGGVG